MNKDLLLRLDHVGMVFGTSAVLSDVSVCVGRGDFWVLTGPNGGGKTTLLRIMAGLLRPSSGRVERAPGLRMGYLPQYRRIDRTFPITVREVVQSGLLACASSMRPLPRTLRDRCDQWLETMGMEAFADQPIEKLSGGQWQRTLLARAMVSQPDLLLLDEPETHLDAGGKRLLHTLLESWRQVLSVVIVSHEADSISDWDGVRQFKVG